jgi:hypothetical protein
MTALRVDAPTTRLPDSTCDTVVGLTPARVATWAIVTRIGAGCAEVESVRDMSVL